jgi:hypothetical protein
MRWFITKKMLVGLIGLLVATILLLLLNSCIRIPVTVSPEFDDAGKPKAIPVTAAGSQDPTTGKFHPLYPVSGQTPTPPAPFPWETILQVALGVLGVGGLGGASVAMRVAGRARTALQIACDLADQNATAETDLDVERNKLIAAQRQAAAGVQALTQAVRGKR